MYLAMDDGALAELNETHRKHKGRLPDPTEEAVTIMLPWDQVEAFRKACRDYPSLRRNDVIRYLVGRALEL